MIPDEKIQKLLSCISNAVSKSGWAGARTLASAIVKIVSMNIDLGSITGLKTRALYATLNCRSSWADCLQLCSDAKEELQFWLENIKLFNGKSIWFSSGATRVAYSDASSTGYGGYMAKIGEVAHGQWSKDEAILSSTWRELTAVFLVLCSFAEKMAGNTVKWFTDNQGVKQIISVGSKRSHLQDGAMAIFEVCFKHSITLEVDWVPRSLNERADFFSRIIDHDDWSVEMQIPGNRLLLGPTFSRLFRLP